MGKRPSSMQLEAEMSIAEMRGADNSEQTEVGGVWMY